MRPVAIFSLYNCQTPGENLAKYAGGDEITYTVKEVDVPVGYTVSYSKDTFTITNVHTPVKAGGSTSTTAISSKVKTGDDSMAQIYWLTLAFSLFGIFTTLLFYRKKKRLSEK